MRTRILMVLVLIVTISVTAQTKKWTLQECVNHAIENNISVKQGELDTEISEENITSTKANFLPNVTGSASGNFNFGSFIGQDGGRISRNSFGSGIGINAGYTIFDGYRNTSLHQQSKLGLESSKLQLDILKDDISLNVVNNYLNVLFNKESLKLAKDQIGISQKQLDQIQELVDAGVRANGDLFDVKAQLASDQERVVNAENSIDLALLSLAQLLQVSHIGFEIQVVSLNMSSVALLYNNTDEIFAKAVNDRPEIKNAELGLKNAELDIKIAKSGHYPTLSLSAGINTSYQHILGEKDELTLLDPNNVYSTVLISAVDPNDLNNPFMIPINDPRNEVNYVSQSNGFGKQFGDNLGESIGLSLRVPIFDGFRTKANVNRAVINNEKAEYRVAQQKQDLRTKIERAFADAKATLNQFESSKLSVSAQEEAFRNAQERYDLGVMTSFEFEQVRSRLLNAQSSLINAKYNFLFKSKLLEFYYGIPIVIE